MGFLFPGTVFDMCDMLGPFCLDSFMDENQDIVSHLVFIQLLHCSPVFPLGILPRFAFPSLSYQTTEIVGQVDRTLAKFPTDSRPTQGP